MRSCRDTTILISCTSLNPTYKRMWLTFSIEYSSLQCGAENLAWMLPLLPVMGAAADYVENFCTLYHIWRLPHQDMAVALIGTVATLVKYNLIFGSMPVIALGFWTNRPRAKSGKAL